MFLHCLESLVAWWLTSQTLSCHRSQSSKKRWKIETGEFAISFSTGVVESILHRQGLGVTPPLLIGHHSSDVGNSLQAITSHPWIMGNISFFDH